VQRSRCKFGWFIVLVNLLAIICTNTDPLGLLQRDVEITERIRDDNVAGNKETQSPPDRLHIDVNGGLL
jgi:hypothetical protein